MKVSPMEHPAVSLFLANQVSERAAVNSHPTTQRSLSLANSNVPTHVTRNVKVVIVFRSQTVEQHADMKVPPTGFYF